MREDAHRLIVQALAATGRKAEALKHYEDLAALLKRELEHRARRGDQGARCRAAQRQALAPTRSAAPTVAAAATAATGSGATALPLPDRPSIAVLAFANMSSDPEQEYFADGIVEDILTLLSRESWLFVIARNSSFAYRRARRRREADRPRARRALRGGGQRAQGGQPRARHRPADRGRDRRARLGRSLRARPERHLRAAGRDHAEGRARRSRPACARSRSGARWPSPPRACRPTTSSCARCRRSTSRPRTAPSAPKRCCARRSRSIPAIPMRWACWPTSSPRARSTAGTRT